jgi:cobalt/nickel transport system permease protein
MTHQWHDSYRHQKTPAHHLDPRSKLFVGLLFIDIVLLTPHFSQTQAVGFPALIVIATWAAGISLGPLVARTAALLPFALLMGVSAWFSHMSLEKLLDVLGKAMCSIATMALLTLTTPFPDFLRAIEQLHAPRLFVMFLGFLYRYGEVLRQEALQLERAWTARYFGRFWFRQWFHLGHVMAALFIRSYERAERVFAAMQARGYSHGAAGVKLLHFGAADALFVATGSLLLSLLRWGRF